jgi:hypothetical protein
MSFAWNALLSSASFQLIALGGAYRDGYVPPR